MITTGDVTMTHPADVLMSIFGLSRVESCDHTNPYEDQYEDTNPNEVIICPDCGGYGYTFSCNYYHVCHECNGNGKIILEVLDI